MAPTLSSAVSLVDPLLVEAIQHIDKSGYEDASSAKGKPPSNDELKSTADEAAANCEVTVHTILSCEGRVGFSPVSTLIKAAVARVLRKYCSSASTQRGTRKTFTGNRCPAMSSDSTARLFTSNP